MKKLLFYSLLGFAYNIFLIALPLVFFLFSLSFSHNIFYDAFLWGYFIFLLTSPIFILILAYRITIYYQDGSRCLVPFIITFISYIPLWVLSIGFSSLWGIRDYLTVLAAPLIIAIVALLLATFRRRFINRNL